jgi:hypothetical protein
MLSLKSLRYYCLLRLPYMPIQTSVLPYIGSFPLAKRTYQGLPRFSSSLSHHAAPDTPVGHQSQMVNLPASADAQCRLSACARAPIFPVNPLRLMLQPSPINYRVGTLEFAISELHLDSLALRPVGLLAMPLMTFAGQLNACGYPSHLPQAT